jgi:hypothetical protein
VIHLYYIILPYF